MDAKIPDGIDNWDALSFVEFACLRTLSVADERAFRPRFVSALLTFLRHRAQSATCINVLRTLPAVARHGCAAVISTVATCLENINPWVRHHAVRTLGVLGCSSDLAVALVVQRLSHPEILVRRSALRALEEIAGKDDYVAVTAVCERLHDVDMGNREAAREILREIATIGHEYVVGGILGQFGSSDLHIQTIVLDALQENIKKEDPALISLISDRLQSNDVYVRVCALKAFDMVSVDGTTIPLIAALLEDTHHVVRSLASHTLRDVVLANASLEASAVEEVCSRVSHANQSVRAAVLESLCMLISNAERYPRAVEQISNCLSDDVLHVREAAKATLKAIIGSSHLKEIVASVAAPFLMLDRVDVREIACSSLKETVGIGNERVISVALCCLECSDVAIRQTGIHAISHFATRGHMRATIALIHCIENSSELEERHILNILHALAVVAQHGLDEAIKAIAGLLKDSRVLVRSAAVDTLFHVAGRGNTMASAILLALLDDDNANVRFAALQALYHIADDGDVRVIVRLKNCLQDENSDVRQIAQAVLQCIEM